MYELAIILIAIAIITISLSRTYERFLIDKKQGQDIITIIQERIKAFEDHQKEELQQFKEETNTKLQETAKEVSNIKTTVTQLKLK